MLKPEKKPVMRELFVEELAEVQGGADPCETVKEAIRELFLTTRACGEELVSLC